MTSVNKILLTDQQVWSVDVYYLIKKVTDINF